METNIEHIHQIRISQIFESCQGEGRHNGVPMLFIRTSGCTRNCDFCDTKYHTTGEFYDVPKLIEIIKNSKLDYVCWTGGEPLLWKDQISQVVEATEEKQHHVETNGDLLKESDELIFNYIACSPKVLEAAISAQKILSYLPKISYDIKVVTDLEKEGVDMIPYATILMPLTTYYLTGEVDEEKERTIQRKVWEYCTQNNIKYACRSHIETWGYKQSGK